MIYTVSGYAAVLYFVIIPFAAAYVYLHTDYSKVKSSVMAKVESTILLACLWPFVILWVVKHRNKDKTKR